jgi:hypothetical protein
VATRTATAAAREAETDSAGRYTFANLAPGAYRVVIEAAGFAPKSLGPVVVEVGRRVPLEAVLDVVGRSETVTVEGHAVTVPTGSSLVGGVVSSAQVEGLPLNGRDFLELALLLRGNAPAPNFDPTKSNTFAVSSAGQLGRGGNITIDGQDDRSTGQVPPFSRQQYSAAVGGPIVRGRAIGSASQRQDSRNRHHQGLLTWTRTLSPAAVNSLRASYSYYRNSIDPVSPGLELTFPSLQDGASFRVPQATEQSRWQLSESLSWVKGAHTLRFGGDVAWTAGRLFAVTLRSGKPDQDLVLDARDSTYVAGFVQDDWVVTPRLTLNAGLRWEMDTNVKNISGYGDINPIVKPFLQGNRGRDLNNFGPRVGFAWANGGGSVQVHGGGGLDYDRVTLEIMSLERGLDGRALTIEVRAPRASTSSTTRCRTPPCSSSAWGRASRFPGTPCCSSTTCTTAARTSSSGGRSARSTTPSSAAPTAS